MSNLKLIEEAFGITFVRECPVFGRKFTETEMLVRRLVRTGGLERVKYPFSLHDSLEPKPTCCLDVALLLAIEGDVTHLAQVCEIGARLDRIRLRKGQELVSIRDARLSEINKDNLGGALGDAVNDRYHSAQETLARALRKEEAAVVSCWTRWGWKENDRQAEIGAAWDRYFVAENALKESLYSKILRLRKKFQD